MQLFIKTLISVLIILGATWIGRKLPSLSGLIAVMPLTGALVLVWMYLDNKGNPEIMQNFTKGAIWGILPSILFFVVALFSVLKDNSPCLLHSLQVSESGLPQHSFTSGF